MKRILELLILALLAGCSEGEAVVSPVRKEIVDAVFATGHLEMSEEYVAATNQEGFIDEVFVKPGITVEVGTPLFRIASPVKSSELATARAQYQEALRKGSANSPSVTALESQISQAESELALEQTNFDRYARLIKSQAVSQLEYDNAKARLDSAQSNLKVLKQNLADLRGELALGVRVARNELTIVESQQDDHLVKAVRPGRVLEVLKERGDLARKGESLCRIGGGEFQAALFVAEEDVHLIEVGQRVTFGLNTHVNSVFNGAVTAVYPAFDGESQSFKLEASIEAGDATLFSGTQLQANVIVALRKEGLAIPVEFVDDGHVWLTSGKSVPVTTGIQTDEWIEVTSGVTEDDQLVARR
ncbi:MAG: efflux RND transporter periplasmic adaptor subunit [Myxococcota bacterium]